MKKNILLLLTASLLILISCEEKPKAIGIIDCNVGMKLRKGPSMNYRIVETNRAHVLAFSGINLFE